MRFNLIFLDRPIRSDIYWAAKSETQSHFMSGCDLVQLTGLTRKALRSLA